MVTQPAIQHQGQHVVVMQLRHGLQGNNAMVMQPAVVRVRENGTVVHQSVVDPPQTAVRQPVNTLSQWDQLMLLVMADNTFGNQINVAKQRVCAPATANSLHIPLLPTDVNAVRGLPTQVGVSQLSAMQQPPVFPTATVTRADEQQQPIPVQVGDHNVQQVRPTGGSRSD